jgi:hypothetical protein
LCDVCCVFASSLEAGCFGRMPDTTISYACMIKVLKGERYIPCRAPREREDESVARAREGGVILIRESRPGYDPPDPDAAYAARRRLPSSAGPDYDVCTNIAAMGNTPRGGAIGKMINDAADALNIIFVRAHRNVGDATASRSNDDIGRVRTLRFSPPDDCTYHRLPPRRMDGGPRIITPTRSTSTLTSPPVAGGTTTTTTTTTTTYHRVREIQSMTQT